MFRFAAFASLLLTTALVLPAYAADPLRPEGWQTGVMRKPDGGFAYCVSESKFEQNLWIILALTPTGDVNLGVGQKGADLPVGNEKPVRIRVDGNPPQEMMARAVKPELMVINAGQSNSLLDAIAKGSRLTVDNMLFSLAGSGEAIATLRECVQASAGAPAVASAPPAVQPAAPPVQTAQAAQVETAPAVAATTQPAAQAAAAPARPEIMWNPAPVAMPGQRDANTLPPSMQQAQVRTQVESPRPAAAAEAPATAALIPAAPPPVLAPELSPPVPDRQIVTLPTVAEPNDSMAVPEPVLPVSAPLASPVVKPLPAQLERLLTTAKLREVEAAPVTENDVAFAWKSRDMVGSVREAAVPAGSNIVQLAGQHLSQLKAQCDVQFNASLGQPEDTGALQLLTGSTVCRGNGKSLYTTLVFALSRQGVLSIISNNIDQGRRAAPDRAQTGIVEALKATQG